MEKVKFSNRSIRLWLVQQKRKAETPHDEMMAQAVLEKLNELLAEAVKQ